MPTPCSRCKTEHIECRVDLATGNCARCVGLGRKCDLLMSRADWARIESQKEKIRLELEAVDEEIAELVIAQATRQQKKLRLRKQLGLLTDREKTAFASELRSIEELERLEYDAAVKGELALPEEHPYHAALSRGFVVPPGEAPPSPSQIPSGSVSQSDLSVDWSSDPLMLDPDSDFWKTVDFGGGTAQPASPSC